MYILTESPDYVTKTYTTFVISITKNGWFTCVTYLSDVAIIVLEGISIPKKRASMPRFVEHGQ